MQYGLPEMNSSRQILETVMGCQVHSVFNQENPITVRALRIKVILNPSGRGVLCLNCQPGANRERFTGAGFKT